MDQNVLIILCVYLTQADHIILAFLFLGRKMTPGQVRKRAELLTHNSTIN